MKLSPPIILKQSVTLPYPPRINAMYATVGNRRILSADARRFKEVAAMTALAAGMRPMAGEVTVSIMFYRPRKAGDVDGRIKSTLDALNGIAYADDSQVRRIIAERDDDKANPRAEVTVEAYAKLQEKP